MTPVRKTLVPALAALSAAILLTACGGSHEKAAGGEAPAPVLAATAKAELSETPGRVELYGTVESDKSAAVSSRVMAAVVAVPVSEGDLVKAGDVLVEIDPQTAKGQEAQARGALAQAKAALSLAERNHQRFQELRKKNACSELELDMARMQFEQATGAVEQAQGAVEAASSVARESRVVAPFAGRVTRKMVDPGELAAPGRPLVMLESATGRRLAISVPESLVSSSGLAVGRTLRVTIDSRPELLDLTGKVVEMSPGADPASHTFAAKLELSGGSVRTGFTGRALLETKARKAVLVPKSAVLPQGGMSFVVVRDDQGKARSRAVTTGGETGDRVEILSGLAGGETVLLGLGAVPRDGAEVREPSGVTR